MMKSIIQIQSDGRIFLDFESLDNENPCYDCGLCCSYFRISFYQGELQSLGGTVPDAMTEPLTPFLVVMKNTAQGNRPCHALSFSFGPQESSPGCSIYSSRPSVCREYQVWDQDGNPNPKCQSLREKAGLSPLLPQSKP